MHSSPYFHAHFPMHILTKMDFVQCGFDLKVFALLCILSYVFLSYVGFEKNCFDLCCFELYRGTHDMTQHDTTFDMTCDI